jgi:NADH-quinone oxidoreductase subunit G
VNTVDICPVGALTSKDFRFKQRVWYLKDKPSVCTGCSTGCNIDVYYNEEGVFRIKPRHNPEVNGYWMCDEGRDIYKHMNKDSRMIRARSKSSGAWSHTSAKDLAFAVGRKLKSYSGQQIAVLLTPQYTNEELEALIKFATEDLKTNHIYTWNDSLADVEKFDGLLIRGDKNPNTQGLKALLKKYNVGQDSKSLDSELNKFKAIIVAGPENSAAYPNLKNWTDKISKLETVVWCSAVESAHFENLSDGATLIPQKVSIEKSGTFTNFSGRVQKIDIVTTMLKNSLNLIETVKALRGEEPEVTIVEDVNTLKTNFFSQERRAP